MGTMPRLVERDKKESGNCLGTPRTCTVVFPLLNRPGLVGECSSWVPHVQFGSFEDIVSRLIGHLAIEKGGVALTNLSCARPPASRAGPPGRPADTPRTSL